MSRARRALSRAYDRPQILFSAAIRSWERPQDLQSRFWPHFLWLPIGDLRPALAVLSLVGDKAGKALPLLGNV